MTGEIFLTDDELSDSQPVRKALTGLSISSLPKNDQLSDNQPVQKTLDGLSVSPLPKVRTTEGFILNWDRNIIVSQLLKETKLSEIFYSKPAITKEEAIDIAKEAEKIIRKMNIKFLSGPLIREIVNNILLDRGHVEWRNIMTRVGASVYDAYEIDSGYGFGANDNANQLNNAETSHKRKADKMSKEQNLLLMPKELSDLHLNGDFHIHDLEYMGTRPFCQDWDLRYFFYYGLMPDGVGTQSSVAKPAKNAEVAFLHAVKAMGSAQTNFAGGQGFYNFLTFIAPYLEGKSGNEIKQLMQMFVYEMMQMMCARGGQTVFSSVQLSPGVPKLWKNIPVVAMGMVWDGKQAPLRTYGEFETEVRLGFKALMDVMLEGDSWGKPFSFPKPEISLEPDFMEEDEDFNRAHPELPTYKELYRLTFELAAKFGTPYFDNQLPEYRGAGEGISCYQCCAYQFSANPTDDKEFDDKLHFRDGKHFSMGSWMVLSLNCPRAAYRAEYDDEKLFTELKNLMNRGVEVFKIKRKWMNSLIKKNRIPFAAQCPKDPNTGEKGAMAVDFDSLVYTIGVVGINEMVQYHTGYQIHESPVAYKLAIRAMFEMKMHAQKLSKENSMEIALARTPAETTAQRFAVSDLLHREYADKAKLTIKGDLKTAMKEFNETRDLPIYYTNGTHIPPGADVSLPERIKYEHTFFPIVDGGNIMHIWLGEGKPDPDGLQELAMHIAKNTQTGYFAFTRDMTVCTDEGYVATGLLDRCPKCGSGNVQHLSRITGYLQSVEGWNRGKRQELRDRKRYGTRELR
ncbi:anaerobic ribonucleoside-triphosphate reductase [Methanosarcina mazei]|uniref:Ribonucleoside-triphosphate reductase n=1 Tax=Methanosarcina mazei TaxID=2209 RepID=A0A0F8NRJ8_METMZ|nr:anaerobic ribonucleoside-triphosphate reductase [Methanosarcina mazei]KKH19853.1 ribonucleoside-triphosphate reductase [Methanosarcina mazei]KKH20461.1 ribonucleoside-triphosphate reductase [Methanosarcina mazei]KKH21390.1 ribonucleoside-triphosphate reductase [Methanosarcina mazei]